MCRAVVRCFVLQTRQIPILPSKTWEGSGRETAEMNILWNCTLVLPAPSPSHLILPREHAHHLSVADEVEQRLIDVNGVDASSVHFAVAGDVVEDEVHPLGVKSDGHPDRACDFTEKASLLSICSLTRADNLRGCLSPTPNVFANLELTPLGSLS